MVGRCAALFAVALAVAALVGLCPAVATAARPSRIVSLNLCTDQILLGLVPPARIRALSHLAADPSVSAVAEAAAGLALTRGEAEVVLGLDPDLVLAGTWSTPATVALLERVGRRVVKVPLASDLAGIRVVIQQVAAAVEDVAAGERLIADLDRRLAAIAPGGAADPRPSALVYQVNGLVSGAGSLADAVLAAAGLENHARRLAVGPGGSVALEAIVADPPRLLVLTGPADEYRTAVADNLRHPALAAVRRQHASVVVPWRYWLCGTQHVATAVELLAAARPAASPAAVSPAAVSPAASPDERTPTP